MKSLLPALLLLAAAPAPAADEKPAPPATTAPAARPAGAVRHVDAAGAIRLLQADKSIVVLDVRTPEEHRAGHLAGATNVDFNAAGFAEALKRLDPKKTYLLHCASGGRSRRSLPHFRTAGITNIIHLDGGFAAWEEAGGAVAK